MPSSTPQRIDASEPAAKEAEGDAPLTAADFRTEPLPDELVDQLAALVREDRPTVEEATEKSAELGKEAFKAGRFPEALEFYTTAGAGYSALGNTERQTATLHNRSLCHEHLGNPRDALIFAKKVLALDITYVKAYLRAGRAYLAMGEPKEARRYLAGGLSRAESSRAGDAAPFKAGLEEVSAALKAEEARVRNAKLASLDAGKFAGALQEAAADEQADEPAPEPMTVELTEAGVEQQKQMLLAQLGAQAEQILRQLQAAHENRKVPADEEQQEKDDDAYRAKIDEVKQVYFAKAKEIQAMKKEDFDGAQMLGGLGLAS